LILYRAPPPFAPKTARGKLFDGFNFRNAVGLAIKDTRDQWRYFRYALHKKHGDVRASRMVCALTRDKPKDCVGRKIALVIDSSSSNLDTDPSNLRIAAARSFNNKLVSAAEAEQSGKADLVTVIDFDTSARIVYPLEDPAGARFDGIDSSGGTNIASGISAAIDELVKNTEYPTFWKSGIVVFTDGIDSNRFALIAQTVRALSKGI
jgi:von Willebrand factor type A domain